MVMVTTAKNGSTTAEKPTGTEGGKNGEGTTGKDEKTSTGSAARCTSDGNSHSASTTGTHNRDPAPRSSRA